MFGELVQSNALRGGAFDQLLLAALKDPPNRTTISRSPTSVTRSPTLVTRSPTSVTRSPTLVTRSPTSVTRSPTSVTRSPTSVTRSPTSVTRSPTLSTPSPITPIPTIFSTTPTPTILPTTTPIPLPSNSSLPTLSPLHNSTPSPRNNKTQAPHHYTPFLPTESPRATPFFQESFPPPYSGECSHAPYWQVCDPPACPSVGPNPKLLNDLGVPVETNWNQSTSEFLQSVMKEAWGSHPPSVDLYVRAGCRGRDELHYLWKTVALFWPQFLGDILVVLDFSDKNNLHALIAPEILSRYNVHVVYEHVPCFAARVFNQYSYLNMDRYSRSEFIVSLDSDCALFRPVTPDVLFNEKGELILVTEQIFQWFFWNPSQFFFTHVSDKPYGHSMVTQPIAFRKDTFAAYFKFVQHVHNHTCYEQVLANFVDSMPVTFYCWMCQLSTFIANTSVPRYDVWIANQRSANQDIYLRYGSHVTYEYNRLSYGDAVRASTLQGLCFWFGQTVFSALCASDSNSTSAVGGDLSYHNTLLHKYNGYDLNRFARTKSKEAKVKTVKDRLSQITQLVVKRFLQQEEG